MAMESPEDWPDPTDWIVNLTRELRHRVEIYEAESDFELKRNKAAAYVGAIAHFLQQLPPFKGKDLLVPIKDLLIFVKALEDGSGHPWAKARNFGGSNAETAAETEVRVWVVMGVWSLLEGGYRRNQAYRMLAKSMTDSGRGRKGKAFSPRNVQRWWLAYEQKRDRRLEVVDRHIQDYWAKMACPHGATMYECPSTQEGRCSEWRAVATEFAQRALLVARFRDWFISPSKNEPVS
jgi:hypothetical protein